jgi:signal peptidase I
MSTRTSKTLINAILLAICFIAGYKASADTTTVDQVAIQLAEQVGAKYIGHTAATGSMVPTLNTGDRLIWLPIKYSEVKVGDIVVFAIAFNPNKPWERSLVAHRVKQIDGIGRIWTQGDANHKLDPMPLDESALQGILVYSVDAVTAVVRDMRASHDGVVVKNNQ